MNYSRADTPIPDSGAADDTRSALIEAGRDLFVTKGFDGASVRAITQRAEANLGAITYHFGSKLELYHAVLESELSPLADRVVAAGDGVGPAVERMAAIVEAYFRHLEDHPHLPRLMLQEIAAGKPPPPVVAHTLKRVMGTLARLQEEGATDGTVRPGHPVLTALSVVAQPIYMTLVSPLLHAFAGLDLADETTRAAAVAHSIAFVRAGLSPTGDAGGNTEGNTVERER
jgi:AcrR family transcriptional regulator